jgi:hypothetical protein
MRNFAAAQCRYRRLWRERRGRDYFHGSREKALCAARVARYLEGLAAACLEAARNPRLLGVLVAC